MRQSADDRVLFFCINLYTYGPVSECVKPTIIMRAANVLRATQFLRRRAFS
jgi:hypothetical protein